jgi:hypothetical protein
MIDEEDKPLFALITTIGGVLLALLAAMLGLTPYERRTFLVLLFTLFFWNILSLINFLDRRFANWFSYGFEIFYHKISYWNGLYRLEHEKTQQLERELEDAKAHIAELDQEVERANNLEQWYKNRLADRERGEAAARRHVEEVRSAAQEQLKQEHDQKIRLQAEIEHLQAQLKVKEEL